MFDNELAISLLEKIEFAVDRILSYADEMNSVDYYLMSTSGMERLESTCMLLIAIGENVKAFDKITGKKFLNNYQDTDWKGIMGMRDIIAHHYFDIDAETVFDVVKNQLPHLKITIGVMKTDILSKQEL